MVHFSRTARVAPLTILLILGGAILAERHPERAVLINALLIAGTIVVIAIGTGLIYGPVWLRTSRWRSSRLMRKRGDTLTYAPADARWDNAFLLDLDNKEPGLERVVRYSAENVVTGELDGFPLVAFDLRVEHKIHRRIHAVVATSTRSQTPLVVVQPGGYDALHTDGEVVELESEDFGRRFTVRTTDRRAAYDVLTPRVMERLLVASHKPGGRDLAWLFVDGYAVAIRLNTRLRPHDVVAAERLLRPVVEVLPRHLEPLVSEAQARGRAWAKRYRPHRTWPFWRRHLVTIGATLGVVAAVAGAVVIGSTQEGPPERDLWTVKDDTGRLVEYGAAWGTPCPRLDLVLGGLPETAERAAEAVAAEARAIGVNVRVLTGPARPPRTPTPTAPHVVVHPTSQTIRDDGATAFAYGFRNGPSARAHLVGVVAWWSTPKLESGDPETTARLYRQAARLTIARGYGLFPHPYAAPGAAISLHPERANDRWSTEDERDLLAQSGCGRPPNRT